MNSSLINRVLKCLEEKRKKVINGGINSIPSPFIRFSEDFLGIEQGKYNEHIKRKSNRESKCQKTEDS